MARQAVAMPGKARHGLARRGMDNFTVEGEVSVTYIDVISDEELKALMQEGPCEDEPPTDCKGLKSLLLKPFDPAEHLTDTGRPTPIVKNERIPDVPDFELYDSRSSATVAAQRANIRSVRQVRASDEEGFWQAEQD